MKTNLIKIRDKVKWINLIFFVLFLIIGFWTYIDNGNSIEPSILGVNINHFSTFFGGSSFVLSMLLILSKYLNIKDDDLHIELFVAILSLIATLWFTYDDEIINRYNFNFSEILGNILGYVFFLIINIIIYKYLNRFFTH